MSNGHRSDDGEGQRTLDGEQVLATLDLLRLVKAGDRDAIEVLFSRYRPRLERWARGRVPRYYRGVMETGDLVDQTLLKVLPRLQSFEPRHDGSFLSYLCESASNQLKDLSKKKEADLRSDGTVGNVADPRPSPAEELLGREVLERIESKMAKLDPADRELIFARLELCLPWNEVAELTGKPTADAARVAFRRALKQLVDAMDDD